MPTYRRAASPEEQLSRYREAVIAGASPAELDHLARGLDPDLVATVRWSLTTVRYQQPEPDPRFVRDLRRRLVQAAGAGAVPAALSHPVPPRPEAPLVVGEPAPVARRARWQWLASLALLAAVLLV
ncbi:MAG: hypothetical protein KC442_24655, partial [Thermomicrobiales bacterium]|nr:hypothetical protein [Thermomicrobiales bacterium]